MGDERVSEEALRRMARDRGPQAGGRACTHEERRMARELLALRAERDRMRGVVDALIVAGEPLASMAREQAPATNDEVQAWVDACFAALHGDALDREEASEPHDDAQARYDADPLSNLHPTHAREIDREEPSR